LHAIVIGNGAAGVNIVSVCVQAARTLDEYLTMCLVSRADVGRRFPRASNDPVVEAFSLKFDTINIGRSSLRTA
jgi:hypothetical protein